MTYEEYKEKLNEITLEFNNKVGKLKKEYIMTNTKYNIGDIVEDHIGKIKIEKIKIFYDGFSSELGCVYYGVDLKKDNTPKKYQTHTAVYFSNVKGGWKK